MVMASSHKIKVLDHFHVGPAACPAAPVNPSTLPLTHFDLFVYNFSHVDRLFLYHLPCSTASFVDAHLPWFKRSLALALSIFRPLAGELVPTLNGSVPTISCSDADAVEMIVAESEDDFDDLVKNHAREESRFTHLVPKLSISESKQGVMILQVTIFPGQGVGVGISTHHAAVDGSSSIHFMKTWAKICSAGDADTTMLEFDLPTYDRSRIQCPSDVLNAMIKRTIKDVTAETWKTMDLSLNADLVRETFVISRAKLDALKKWVLAKTSISCSDFVLSSSVAWTCLVKLRNDDGDSNKMETFGFVANCRSTTAATTATGLAHVPANYFGNCIYPCMLEVSRKDLVGEDGLVKAALAISDLVKGFKARVGMVEDWTSNILKATNRPVTVAGSPRLGVYDVDFGWGRPKKMEIVSIAKSSAISLAENIHEDGGIEVGLTSPLTKMEEFGHLLKSTLEIFSQ